MGEETMVVGVEKVILEEVLQDLICYGSLNEFAHFYQVGNWSVVLS